MKSIAIEQGDQQIAEAIRQQRRDEPLMLTMGTDAVALLLRLPEGMKNAEVDNVIWLEEPTGRVYVVIDPKSNTHAERADGMGQPVFGSCRGMMSIVSEDEEHLVDFKEYME